MGSSAPLQAIIVADSFTTKLGPITLECPKVLLPLVNTPMIDLTLAWLESADVEQVFVLCSCSHSKQITNYLDKSKWAKKPKFSVTTIECTSAGDALRTIHKRNVIRGDFILVSGDTVSNMVLRQALEEHKERNQRDKNAGVMTMVIKQSEACQVVGRDEIIMGIDPITKQLVYYENKADDVKFDKSFLSVNPCLSLHNDKQDCFIDICSPQVLGLFTKDNYDYQHLRRDFVKGLLEDDVMGFKVFTHELDSSVYAARMDNFGSYDLISKYIIHRSLVPDFQFSTTKLQQFAYIGKDTITGKDAVISNSVVGDGCKIGSNVTIDGCYIWNNVTIEDGCKLRDAIVCDGVVMRSGAVLKPGVVLSYKVVVGQEFVCSKVSLLQQPVKQGRNKYGNVVVSDMGEDGRGFIRSMSEVVDHQQQSVYEKKVEKIFLRGVDANARINDILHALPNFNMAPGRCGGALLYSFMRLALDNSKKSGKNDLVKETNNVISKWGNLLKFLSRGGHWKIQLILRFERMCLEESMKEYAPLFVEVLHILYDKNIIQKDVILMWANRKDPADEVFVKQSEEFIQRLNYQNFQETDLKRLYEGCAHVKKRRKSRGPMRINLKTLNLNEDVHKSTNKLRRAQVNK